MRAQFILSGDGLCIGYDSGDAVAADYNSTSTVPRTGAKNGLSSMASHNVLELPTWNRNRC